MKCTRLVAIVFALSVLAVGTPIAQGADKGSAASGAQQTTADVVSSQEAETPPRDDAEPQKPDKVLKTKTRSNQSNDRVATSPQAADDGQPVEPDAVLKTKTKSNQSNDRVATSPQATDDGQPVEPDAVLKSKTKSNQSND